MRPFDKPAMIMGVIALVCSGLYFLNLAGAIEVDEVVTAVSLWVGLALVGLVRAGLGLQHRLSQRSPG